MKIIGINSGVTNYGMPLKDGGCCLIEDGNIRYLLHEERIIGKKYAGGFKESLKEILKLSNSKIADIDLFVFSSCCDTIWNNNELKLLNLPIDKIIALDHHISHAFSSFAISPFEEALVAVIDNEGNILESINKRYWKCPIERTSYYHAKRNKKGIISVKLIDRDGADGSSSVGEVYSQFTYYLGWKSYVYAGKVMGLAPYGKNTINVSLFECKEGHIIASLPNNQEHPEENVQKYIEEKTRKKNLPPIYDTKNINFLNYADMAYLVQKEIERAMTYKVNFLVKKHGIKNICLSGGVALNCVMNAKLLELESVKNVFIPPAPGDSGQCLGNALYGYNLLCMKNEKKPEKISFTPYLGREFSNSQINLSLKLYDAKINVKKLKNKFTETAELLEKGKVIGWFNARSEIGPRALGNRSILADPRLTDMNLKINKIKNRELFRPLAPIVMEEYVDKYFNIIKNRKDYSYMLFTLSVKAEDIPAVTHVDKSSRVQTVNSIQNTELYLLLKTFYAKTRVPVLLNTSLNYAGDPLCDTPEDALKCLLKTEIDYLVMGNYLIEKRPKKSEKVKKHK